ncbi:unnamed protein product [Sphenostylis stenocarpa]|uniref:Uncharacterized protein n=1 Tax=Sphenostylis stenocarpa TaxID=92480 RepID=A0AA86RL45_9FABA|nr:unnamed protein product [Sphenostylis stenocarpa]
MAGTLLLRRKDQLIEASNTRGRFIPGRAPGYRGDGARGRGNYGNGRNYGRGDFNGRGDYGYRNGNRGGFSSRGGDGYQRNDHHMGPHGGRMNRPGGAAANPPFKPNGVRVPASA